jgi:hypothetical protein
MSVPAGRSEDVSPDDALAPRTTSPELLYVETKWGIAVSLCEGGRASERCAARRRRVESGDGSNQSARNRGAVRAGVGRRTASPVRSYAGGLGTAGTARWSDNGGNRWRLRPSSSQRRVVRSDRRQERRGISARGRGRDTVSQVLRVRSDLRRQTAPPAVGADEIARYEREPAGGFHVRRRRDRSKASRVPSSVQRARNRLVSHHHAIDGAPAADGRRYGPNSQSSAKR